MTRQFAPVLASAEPLKTQHYVRGAPAPRAALVVLDATADGVFLYRYASDGAFVGDTWHPSVEEARGQATYEFNGDLGPWRVVPDSAPDPVAYALDSVVSVRQQPDAGDIPAR